MKILNTYIKLYIGKGKRKHPIQSGYRPLFKISDGNFISGHIELLNKNKLKPGGSAKCKITFLNFHLLGNKTVKKMYFSEGFNILGEIEIIPSSP